MTEPLYTYVRGTGWVLRPPFETRVVKCKGATVRIEARMPEIGEVCLAVWDRAYVFSPGVPKLGTVSTALLGYITNPAIAFEKCTAETLDKRNAEALRYDTIPSWITIIPLD